MTTRTSHTIPTAGRSASGLIGQVNRDHQRGRGRKLRHRKGLESNGDRLAASMEAWLKRNPTEEPTFTEGRATKAAPPPLEPNPRAQAALAEGGRIHTSRNGAITVRNRQGHIIQNLRQPTRTSTGRFSRDPTPTDQPPRTRNLNAARKTIDAFFGKHDPSSLQLKGALKGILNHLGTKGRHTPTDLTADDL